MNKDLTRAIDVDELESLSRFGGSDDGDGNAVNSTGTVSIVISVLTVLSVLTCFPRTAI